MLTGIKLVVPFGQLVEDWPSTTASWVRFLELECGMARAAKSVSMVFPGSLIHSQISSTSTDHRLPLKTEYTDHAPVQVVCSLWVIMLIKHVCTHTRTHSGKQNRKKKSCSRSVSCWGFLSLSLTLQKQLF